jgi:hypothetical protein
MGASALHQPDFFNAPRVGAYTMNAALFDQLTQRMELRPQDQAIPTGVVGERMNFKLPARGILSDLRLHFDLTVTIASYSAQTVLDLFPYGLVRTLSVRANNTDLVKCNGLDLEILRRMRYKSADFSDIEATTIASSNGAKDVDFILDIPLCTDATTRTGSVFAQTDDTYLEVDVQFESQANLATLTGGTTWAWTGTVKPAATAWEIPTVTAPNGSRAIVLPDLGVHHIVGTRNTYINSSGVHKAEFSRTYGQLMRFAWTIWDESAKGFINPLTGGVSEVKFQYGLNQTLRRHTVRDLMHLNVQWFRKILGKGYLAFDFVAENSLRDVVVPAEVMDMELELDLSGATIGAGDYIHTLEEVVIKNEAFTQSQPIATAA